MSGLGGSEKRLGMSAGFSSLKIQRTEGRMLRQKHNADQRRI